MKDIIYLTVSSKGVQKMNKSFVGCRKDEIVVKLTVDVAEDAFNPPILEQHVHVNDWRDGVDIEDVHFNQNVITEEEAGIIRAKRIEKMKGILESQGFEVTKPE